MRGRTPPASAPDAAASRRLQRATARRAKEDFHRLLAQPGTFVVYRTGAPIRTFDAYAFFPGAVTDLAFSASADGVAYSPMEVVRSEYFEAGELDAAAYGYWRPVSYRPEAVPHGTRYLKIEFPVEAELSRIEIAHGGEATAEPEHPEEREEPEKPEEPAATAPSSS